MKRPEAQVHSRRGLDHEPRQIWGGPHILVLMSDQQRWDTVLALGFPHILTPSLDALVARAVAFTTAYAQGTFRAPSRASLVTGQYVHAHGAERNETWPDGKHPNWIEALREVGHHTVSIGKMPTAPIRLPCGSESRHVAENKNYQQEKVANRRSATGGRPDGCLRRAA